MESEGGKMESDPPWPARALFQPGYRSHCDPPCLSFRTLSRQALINISTLLRQPLGGRCNCRDADARVHGKPQCGASSESTLRPTAACTTCQTTGCNTGKGCCGLLNREGGTDGGGGGRRGRNKERGKVFMLCFSKVHFIVLLKPNKM